MPLEGEAPPRRRPFDDGVTSVMARRIHSTPRWMMYHRYMAKTGIKPAARQLVEDLPEESTWDDLVYRIYLEEAIEHGRRDIREGRVFTTEEVRKNVGLPG